MGLNYNFNGTANWNDLLSGAVQQATQAPQQQRTLNII
jgi:hypothetical protein